jgi:NhaA family Na+:H+ antiporter
MIKKSAKKLRRNFLIKSTYVELFNHPSALGIILISISALAMIWANSPYSHSYFDLWETHFNIGFGTYNLNKSLSHWINDALMAVFFFYVGLEIKREMLYGTLSSFKKASLPILAALGGMIFPAIIYLAFNLNTNYMGGWAIPTATDIAFALGVLSILGNRIPSSAKIFLTALAIADDLGAVLVIAIFYTSQLNFIYLILAFVLWLTMYIANLKKVNSFVFFILSSILLWFLVMQSNIHATIAGVLAAITIPSEIWQSKNKTNLARRKFFFKGNELNETNNLSMLESMEHALKNWVSFLIMPLFALANAGVYLGNLHLEHIFSTVTQGIIWALLLGKTFGVYTMSYFAIKFKISSIPEDLDSKQMFGVAILAGIGFTMSLFIANLWTSNNREILDEAKIGIIIGSILSGLIASIYLIKLNKKTKNGIN